MIGIGCIERFNYVKSDYEQKLEAYNNDIKISKLEARTIDKNLKNELKKLNLLKYTGLRTSVNKYIMNMKFFKIKINTNIKVTEESLEDIKIKSIKHKSFDDYINFNKKNNIQKLTSILFKGDLIEERLKKVQERNEKNIIRNKILILERYTILEKLIQKQTYMKYLLEEISKIEIEFAKNKEYIMYDLIKNEDLESSKPLQILNKYKELIDKFVEEI